MEKDKKLKNRTYFWIFLCALLLFPILWMWQASAVSPYATGLYVDMDQKVVVDAVHPIGPNRIERFGTDPLGRNITTLAGIGIKTTLLMALIAAIIRTTLTLLATRSSKLVRLKEKLSFPLVFVMEVLVLRALLFSPYVHNQNFMNNVYLFAGITGLFFLSSLVKSRFKNKKARTIFVAFLNEFGWVVVTFAIVGLFGGSLGANPYGFLPTNGAPVPYTEPELMTMIASLFAYGLQAPWTWGIPLIITILVGLLAITLSHTAAVRVAERGQLLPRPLAIAVNFFNPKRVYKEFVRFRHYVPQNILRGVLLLVVAVFVYFGRPESTEAYRSIPNINYEETYQETNVLTTEDERLAYVEELFTKNRMHPREAGYRTEQKDQTVVAASILGLSRVRPLAFVFDVGTDPATFALHVSLVKGVINSWQRGGFQQSFFFAFSKGDQSIDYLQLMNSMHLNSPSRAIYLTMDEMRGDNLIVDETMLLPATTAGSDVAIDMRKGFAMNDKEVTVGSTHPLDPISTVLKMEGLSGIRFIARGEGDQEDMQETLDSILSGSVYYALRRFR